MEKMTLNKKQSKEIAQSIYGDVKGYCTNHYERYFLFMLNDIRKSKGKPPLRSMIREETWGACNG